MKNEGRTELHWACSAKDATKVEELILTQDVNAQDDAGWTPLVIACSVGSLQIVKLLSRADPNLCTDTKVSPLHYAISKNQPEIASLLIQRNADVNAQDSYGQTPLFRAASLGHCLKLLIDNGAKVFILTKVNARDATGSTPLHFAIENEQGDAAIYLLENNADPDIANNEQKTPLQMTRNQDLLSYILKN
jgi:ankyrin repeat protein